MAKYAKCPRCGVTLPEQLVNEFSNVPTATCPRPAKPVAPRKGA